MLTRLLRCPHCDSQLTLDGEAVCPTGHRFPIVDGVLVLLDEEAVEADPQYRSQRANFDAEFAGYARYALETCRAAYLDRVAAAGLSDAAAGPVVDVGVGGSGYTVIEAARAGLPAIGCDLSPEGLTAATSFAATEGVSDRTLWL